MRNVDAVVIGSGQGGVPLAVALAQRGQEVVLFERSALGGCCINVGCTPSKAFLAAAHAAGRARRARALGVHGEVKLDFRYAMERVERIVTEFREGVGRKLDLAGVDVIRAEATFTGEREVSGGGTTLSAPLVVINTGASPAIPKIEGLAGTPYLTNETFFTQRELPRRMLVMGGGYVGLELGQGMLRAGSSVDVFHTKARILDREEEDASETLHEALVGEGLRIHLNARVTSVQHDGSTFTLRLDDGTSYEGERLLVAVGRPASTASLHCERSGVKLDERGTVAIDDRFETTCKGIYAIGDVAGQPALTHVSWEDHRRLLAILDGEPRNRHDRVLGYTTFTEPQIARAGETIDQARKRGAKARAATVTLDSVARGIEWGEERGFYRLVVDEESEKLIGATFVGYEAGELVHILIAHMEAGSTWHVLDRSVHIHPTFAEALPGLAREFAPMPQATGRPV